MVRNIVILSGNSNPRLTESICSVLGIPPGKRTLTKFSGGETRCEIQDSVRGKDVYIVQTGGGAVNDHVVELCIMISACKIGSAKRITVVTPLFPYSRQPDLPYRKAGAPLNRHSNELSKHKYTFESVPVTPGPGMPRSEAFNSTVDIGSMMTVTSVPPQESSQQVDIFSTKPGYQKWVAQAGALVANLLACAGADHIVAMDLHDAQYQGFFDIPMDNLYGRPLLQRYIQRNIPNFKNAVIVSPDAGGAKRATAIADSLGIEFALIHKDRRPTNVTERQNAAMMLVGSVAHRACILIDDLVDTGNTITRAAKLLRREGATAVYALLTHGIFSGDALARVAASALDRVIVTNSVPQDEHQRVLGVHRLEVLDVAPIFAEAIRRIHHGESMKTLFMSEG